MMWWGWIIGGAILFGAELALVNAQFYLVFVGSAAMIVGLLSAVAPLAGWAQWALFAVLAIASMLAFRSRVYRRFHSDLPPVNTGPVGGLITLETSLAAGESCKTEFRGTSWTVRNISALAISAGARARITRVHDLTLLVEPAP